MTSWKISRTDGLDLGLDEVLELYRDSGLGARRPIDDRERFAGMLANANLIVACRIDGKLAGIARALSDFCYATYLCDIAVAAAHQRTGIGRALIEAVQAEAAQAKIVLLSAPAAVDYYPRLGFVQPSSAWVLNV